MHDAKPEPTKQQRRSALIFVGCLLGVILFLQFNKIPAFFADTSNPNANKETPIDQLHNLAFLAAQDFARDQLKAPATAEFPADYAKGGVKHLEDGLYYVHSYVNAQNTFGAKLRTFYICKLQTFNNGHDWVLKELVFNE